ncbi:hypothetical protein ACRZTM_003334 [Acinetobacter baumannii]|nr:hypothetical protein [Acinetobacter baumannii]EKX2780090.1 hypothetical protein [Acinetobacter baumannii]ELB1472080.1 hypothetical protein [Acinetobacter baumannii]
MPSEKDEKRQKNIETIAIGFGLVFMFVFWLKYPKFVEYINKANTPIVVPYKPGAQFEMTNDQNKTYMQRIGENYGTYGDSYGSLNTLFSGLAFAALFISLLLQRRELEAQRKEIAATREETEKSNTIAENQRKITAQQAKLLEQQIKEAQIQNFYDVFFKLLDEKRKKISSLVITSIADIPPIVGDACFKKYPTNFHLALKKFEDYPTRFESRNNPVIKHINERITAVGTSQKYLVERSYYFEFMIYIIEFIESNHEIINTYEIMNTFVSTLTFNEVILLGWLGINNKKIENCIVNYGLLRSIDPINSRYLFKFFDKFYGSSCFTKY